MKEAQPVTVRSLSRPSARPNPQPDTKSERICSTVPFAENISCASVPALINSNHDMTDISCESGTWSAIVLPLRWTSSASCRSPYRTAEDRRTNKRIEAALSSPEELPVPWPQTWQITPTAAIEPRRRGAYTLQQFADTPLQILRRRSR